MNISNLNNKQKKNSLYGCVHALVGALLLTCGVVMTPWTHAQNASEAKASAAETKLNVLELGNVFEVPGQVDPQKTRLIFYRSSASNFKGAATIYFNGMYHASLGHNTYTTLCASPGTANIGVKPVVVGGPIKTSLDSISSVDLQGGRNQYLRVMEDRNIKVFQPVKEQEAIAELATSQEQIHTISRVTPVEVCTSKADQRAVAAPVEVDKTTTPTSVVTAPQTTAVTPPLPSLQTITLGADALFEFAGSNRKALGDKGSSALDKLILDVKASYSSIERIHVVGYADPIGTVQFNERLAKERAQTVSEYLKENGFQTTAITSAGRGSNAPIVSSCGLKPTPENILCNAPNRRVMVAIKGIKR